MTPQKEPAKIMIIDDTTVNLKLLDKILQKQGYHVLSFPRGELALKGIQKNQPDLILLDINMPDMNGYEVCENLKSDGRFKKIPIIFISALNEAVDKAKAFRKGGADYITKPFQVEEVLSRVKTQLQLMSYRKQLSEVQIKAQTAEVRKSEFLDTLATVTSELKQLGEKSVPFIKTLEKIAASFRDKQ